MGSAANRPCILYVEDHIATSEMVTDMLSDCQVKVAHSVVAGVELATDECFDLYLTDYQLPDGNGLDFCRQARAFDPVTPIILVSASRSISLQHTMAGGAQHFIRKGWGYTEE